MATLEETLVSVWRQVLVESRETAEVEGRSHRVAVSRHRGLKMVSFPWGEATLEGIEQNPETKSRWAQLAREGKRIMQFKARGRYFANVCDGAVVHYPAWKGLGLPA